MSIFNKCLYLNMSNIKIVISLCFCCIYFQILLISTYICGKLEYEKIIIMFFKYNNNCLNYFLNEVQRRRKTKINKESSDCCTTNLQLPFSSYARTYYSNFCLNRAQVLQCLDKKCFLFKIFIPEKQNNYFFQD